MKRFLRRELVRAGFVVPVAAAAEARARPAERVVFLRLRGGADALSLVVPYRNDDYQRARPTTRVAALPLDADHGLHPSLRRLLPLFERGELGAVVGAGFRERLALHGKAEAAVDRAILAAAGGAATSIELAGWDTHVAQAARMPALLEELCQRLLALRSALAADWVRSRIVVVSEFGRGLHETLLGGTDDGHAQTVLILSGARDQGRVRGLLRFDEQGLVPTSELGALLAALVAGRGG
jgi:uncharacterized protein (DUF1501 family)